MVGVCCGRGCVFLGRGGPCVALRGRGAWLWSGAAWWAWWGVCGALIGRVCAWRGVGHMGRMVLVLGVDLGRGPGYGRGVFLFWEKEKKIPSTGMPGLFVVVVLCASHCAWQWSFQ